MAGGVQNGWGAPGRPRGAPQWVRGMEDGRGLPQILSPALPPEGTPSGSSPVASTGATPGVAAARLSPTDPRGVPHGPGGRSGAPRGRALFVLPPPRLRRSGPCPALPVPPAPPSPSSFKSLPSAPPIGPILLAGHGARLLLQSARRILAGGGSGLAALLGARSLRAPCVCVWCV